MLTGNGDHSYRHRASHLRACEIDQVTLFPKALATSASLSSGSTATSTGPSPTEIVPVWVSVVRSISETDPLRKLETSVCGKSHLQKYLRVTFYGNGVHHLKIMRLITESIIYGMAYKREIEI